MYTSLQVAESLTQHINNNEVLCGALKYSYLIIIQIYYPITCGSVPKASTLGG